jgi:hypothetical protein
LTIRQLIDPDFMDSVGLSVQGAVDEWYRIIEYGLIRSPA